MKVELLLNELEVFWAVSSPGKPQACTLDRSVVPVVIAALKAAVARCERNKLRCEAYSCKVIFECDEAEAEFAKLVDKKE